MIPPSAGPCLETFLGEAFRLEPNHEGGAFRVSGVGEELHLARAFPTPTEGVACSVEDVPESRTVDPSVEESISSTRAEFV